MTSEINADDGRKALARRPDRTDYEVGYGKPPKNRRFQPGQSGNPKGRPKGTKNRKKSDPGALPAERLQEIVLEEAYRFIKVNDGPNQINVPMAQAIVRSLAHSAVKGNARAQRLFTDLLSCTEEARERDHLALFETAFDYKRGWQQEIERCLRQGIEPPNPIPHPDHIELDPRTGTVRIRGPVTEAEQFEYDWWKDRKQFWENELPKRHAELAEVTDPDRRALIEDEIRNGEELLADLSEMFPDEDPRRRLLAQKRCDET